MDGPGDFVVSCVSMTSGENRSGLLLFTRIPSATSSGHPLSLINRITNESSAISSNPIVFESRFPFSLKGSKKPGAFTFSW